MLLCHLSSLQDCAQHQRVTIFYLTKQVSFLTEMPTCTFLRCALYRDLCNFRESRIRVADFQRQCCSYSQPISLSAEFLSVLYHVSDAVSCLLLAGDARTLLPPKSKWCGRFLLGNSRLAFKLLKCYTAKAAETGQSAPVTTIKIQQVICTNIQHLQCLHFGKTVTPSIPMSMIVIFHF